MCEFFLVSIWKKYLVSIAVVAFQIHLLCMFIRASYFTYDVRNYEHPMICANSGELSDNTRFISFRGWIIFDLIIFCLFLKTLPTYYS